MNAPHKQNIPPKWLTNLVKQYCSDYYKDEVLGDMLEAYTHRIEQSGKRRADWSYFLNAIKYCRPYIIKGPPQGSQTSNFNWIDMIDNHFKIGARSLRQNKTYTAISVLGLSIGIACCILIGMYVEHELSYDNFFKGGKNIYRVVLHQQTPEMQQNYAVTHIMLGPTLEDNFPEVTKSTRVHRLYFHPEMTIMTGEKSFAETRMFLADNQFFEVFDFEFVEGSPVDALATNKHVVLTEKIALKYFGNEGALGKTLKLDFGRELVVSGVIRDLPENSHFNFDLLGSIEFMLYLKDYIDNPDWSIAQVCTYVSLQQGSNYKSFEAKLPALVDRLGKEQIQARFGKEVKYELELQPLSTIHLYSQLDAEMKANGNITNIYLLSILAAFILSISCINFINLSTARSVERAKEVGIRKVLGSGKKSLILQFLTESVIISIISLTIAIIIILLITPAFNQIVAKSFQLVHLAQPLNVLIILFFTLIIGLAAGWYPALVITSVNSTSALKGKYKSSRKGILLRNGLVIFQFFIAVALISATLLIDRQMSFISSKKLGFNTDQILLIKHPLSLGQHDKVDQGEFERLSLAIINHANQKIDVFKNELRKIVGINEVGGAFQIMGHRFSLSEFETINAQKQIFTAHLQSVDSDFVPAMDIEVISGRALTDSESDRGSVLINETAVRKFGWDNPIGRRFKFISGDDSIFKVIGVVKDFHYQSLRDKINPLIINNGRWSIHYFPTALVVNVQMSQIDKVIDQIEMEWNKMVSEEALNITFLNDDLGKMYENEKTSKKMINFFTALAILLACVGLFGLATFTTQQKTKEIGIRKVLGASVSGIILLLSKSFIKLIVLSFIIAIPATYYGINLWLENFAYRIEIDVIPFLVALVLTIILAFITISHQALKAALINPVKSLSSE